MLRRSFLQLIGSLPLAAAATKITGPNCLNLKDDITGSDIDIFNFVRATIAENFGVKESLISPNSKPCELDPGGGTGIFAGLDVASLRELSYAEVEIVLEEKFDLSLPSMLEMSVQEIVKLIESELANPVMSDELNRKHRIESLLYHLERVPNNGPYHDSIPDPTATAQAVNAVIAAEQSIVQDAIDVFVSRFPNRNNLQTLLYLWLEPINERGLTNAVVVKDGFTFFLPPDSLDSSRPNDLSGAETFSDQISSLSFKTKPISLPADPLPTLRSVLAEVDSATHLYIIHQFMISAGLSIEIFSQGCVNPSDLLQRIADVGIVFDTTAGWYCGRVKN